MFKYGLILMCCISPSPEPRETRGRGAERIPGGGFGTADAHIFHTPASTRGAQKKRLADVASRSKWSLVLGSGSRYAARTPSSRMTRILPRALF